MNRYTIISMEKESVFWIYICPISLSFNHDYYFTVGKCAYFNTYGSGNVDEGECKPGINLTCSERNHQFESRTNTKCK